MIGFIVTMLLIMLVSQCSSKKSSNNTSLSNQSHQKNIDNVSGDTVTETLNTLTAAVRKTQNDYSKLAKSNQDLKSELKAYQSEQKQNNAKNIQQHVKNTEYQQHVDKPTDDSTNSTDDLANQVHEMQGKPSITTSDTQAFLKQRGQTINIVNDISGYHAQKISELKKKNQQDKQKDKPKSIPFYTIPPNATSINTAMMTAIIGRVPLNGKVDDPYPFKLVIGSKNLAANGLYMPEISGMIATGYAIGDMDEIGTFGQKCARGYVTSVTFIFNDGTISTQSSNNNDKATDSDDSNALGWISDAYGNPCLDGKFYTNAPKYLAIDMGLNAASGAADAYSNSETTTLASGDSLITGVTGSSGKYVLGQALSNSTKDTSDWIQNRLSQSFDAVVVKPTNPDGSFKQIAIHFQHEIDIDYNPTGRKIRYAHSSQNNTTRHLD